MVAWHIKPEAPPLPFSFAPKPYKKGPAAERVLIDKLSLFQTEEGEQDEIYWNRQLSNKGKMMGCRHAVLRPCVFLTKMADEAQFSSMQCCELIRGQFIALNGISELTSLFLIMKVLAGCIKPMGENSVKWGCVSF